MVKLRAGERMSVTACLRELLASFIAHQLEMTIPSPAIVRIDSDFEETMVGNQMWGVVSRSLGSNFGSVYRPGLSAFTLGQKLTTNQKRQAYRVFGFDVLIGNVDRRLDKQNMLTDGDRILIFDHELSFVFEPPIPPNPTPWKPLPEDRQWILKHYFYNHLRRSGGGAFDEFIGLLGNLTNEFWERVGELTPPEWVVADSFSLERVMSYLTSIVQHREEFRKELVIALA